jgi:RNA polymerase sigma-70 factor (ECF subfamily)
MDESDSDIVRQAKAELPYQHTAYEVLVRRHYPGIRKLIAGIVGSPDEADSLTQDVMLRMMHGLSGLEDAERFEAWLRRIAVNVTRTFLTRRARELRRREAYQLDQALTLPEAHTPAEASEESMALASLMAPLTPDERMIVSFKVLQDLEFAEIAEILNISLSAAKMRYYRALDKLKKEERA